VILVRFSLLLIITFCSVLCRTDKIINLTAGVLIFTCLAMSASGYHKLQNGYGKKDGF